MTQRILVVDDDPLIRTLIRVSMGTQVEVVEAVDGDQAMALFDDSRFDLVLLDVFQRWVPYHFINTVPHARPPPKPLNRM